MVTFFKFEFFNAQVTGSVIDTFDLQLFLQQQSIVASPKPTGAVLFKIQNSL
jgi:hypothetical protein